jgi:hypothetical protein
MKVLDAAFELKVKRRRDICLVQGRRSPEAEILAGKWLDGSLEVDTGYWIRWQKSLV